MAAGRPRRIAALLPLLYFAGAAEAGLRDKVLVPLEPQPGPADPPQLADPEK